MAASTKKRELNDMNAIACLLVILIHVLSIGISSVTPSSWQAAVIYFPWRLAAFVVPMFLYTGAVKMALHFMDRELTLGGYLRYMLQRIQKIYLPYVLWVVIYYACFLRIGYVRGEGREFFSYLLLGNLSSPFYYIVIVMQFYLLMPFWLWMVKHIPAYLALGVSLLTFFFMQQFSYILSLGGIDFPYSDRIFLTYLLFWVAGLYVGKHYKLVAASLSGGLGQAVCGGVVLVCAGLAYLQYSGRSLGLNLNDVKLVADLLSIALVHAVCLRLACAPGTLRRGLERLYQSSFFVYLSHCLFLTLGTYFLQRRGVGGLSVLLAARLLICYTLPFLAYFLYDSLCTRFQLRWRLLG